ncbi:hypothetical protein JSO19_03890 [Leucobacter sp. UCMA 4100]|uniref:hypothetical protein n=1 Tax=Leucobacter sp. UCMA 4100 TaxID=2810534 RepID=UPI0022EB9FF7|nr:hypothetical protein [Leucobacter sp. UCMA 4100]MDA3146517.1 hypothetical protein [Leucobacter sp. UCMA 4100]
MIRERGARPAEPVFDEAGPSLSPAPVDWWSLSDEERHAELQSLVPFVLTLVEQFVIPEAEIPRCWYQHQALVQELLAVKQYREQQFDTVAAPQGPIDFHYNLYAMVRPRLRAFVQMVGCNAAKHKPDENIYPSWMVPGSTDVASWLAEVQEYFYSVEMNHVGGATEDKAGAEIKGEQAL